MRLLLSIAALSVCAITNDASACEARVEDYRPYFAGAAVRPGWEPGEPGDTIVSARPSFFGYLGPETARELPVFTRLDGSLIPTSGPYPVTRGAWLHRIDLAIDEGVILVHYPDSRGEPERYVVDPAFVPRLRRAELETDRIADWLHIESDAIALRIEQADGSSTFDLDTRLVLLGPEKVRIFALYGDGREQVIFERPAGWHERTQPAERTGEDDGSRSGGSWAALALLVACVTMARRAELP